jgi:multicomponent Na+:H+ antiporter subunit E
MQKRRLTAIAATFVPCYVFWLLLTMSLAPVELLSGVVVCLITAWFSSGFFVRGEEHPFHMLNPLRLLLLLVYLFGVFFWELVKSNVAMAKIVLGNKPLKQAVVKVPVHGITDYYALGLLADCITLTPGTITLDVVREGETYSMYVQWLVMESDDPEQAGEIIKGRMERWIGRIWG